MRPVVLAVILLAGSGPALAASGRGRDSKPAHAARRPNPRTGRLAPAFAELVKAHKRGDRRRSRGPPMRMGLARLGEAMREPPPGVGEAALAALPLARGGVLLVGAVTDLLDVVGRRRARRRRRAALGALLDGADAGARSTDWEVPPDVVARACAALRGAGGAIEAAVAARAGGARTRSASASVPSCGSRRRSWRRCCAIRSPAVRRAAALVLRPAASERDGGAARRDARSRAPAVAAAAAPRCAATCRPTARAPARRQDRARRRAQAIEAGARDGVVAPATPPEDAVEMLGCLARRGARPPIARCWISCAAGPPSPLRDRAVELDVGAPARLKPQ